MIYLIIIAMTAIVKIIYRYYARVVI